MLTVDDYARIRRAYRDRISIREIARRFHHSRRKVREALAGPEPEPYRRSREPVPPKLGRFKARIDEIPAADEAAGAQAEASGHADLSAAGGGGLPGRMRRTSGLLAARAERPSAFAQ